MSIENRTFSRLFDIELSNPIFLASGPLSDTLSQIQQAFSAGIGGVVTKTIYNGEKNNRQGRIIRKTYGTFNSTTYSKRAISDWLNDLEQLVKMNLPVIASIYADSPYRLAKLVREVTSTNIRAIELGISCPNDHKDNSKTISDFVRNYTKAARDETDLPISVKLTANAHLLLCAKIAIDNGASGITVSDTLPSIVIDVEKRKLYCNGILGYSGVAIKPIVLHSIYRLRQAGIKCPIIGVGGVSTVSDVLEYLQVGCSAVQLLSEVMNNGLDHLNNLVVGLDNWLEKHNLNVSSIIGSTL